LNFAYVSAEGNTFADLIAVTMPDDLSEAGELYPEASASGDVVQMVPADKVAGGVRRVEEAYFEATSGQAMPSRVARHSALSASICSRHSSRRASSTSTPKLLSAARHGSTKSGQIS
jgi:hypothetical protein